MRRRPAGIRAERATLARPRAQDGPTVRAHSAGLVVAVGRSELVEVAPPPRHSIRFGNPQGRGACNKGLIGLAPAQVQLSMANSVTASKEHYYVTPENEMKRGSVKAARGAFNFAPRNAIVTFANSNSMTVRGHTLVWRGHLLTWVSSLSSAADVKTVMVDPVAETMTAFWGKICVWDIVNQERRPTTGRGMAPQRCAILSSYRS